MKSKLFLFLIVVLFGCGSSEVYRQNLEKLIANTPDFSHQKWQINSYLKNECTNIDAKSFKEDFDLYAKEQLVPSLAEYYLQYFQERLSEDDLIAYVNVLTEEKVNSAYHKMHNVLRMRYNIQMSEYSKKALLELSKGKVPRKIVRQEAPLMYYEFSDTLYRMLRFPVTESRQNVATYARNAGMTTAEYINTANDVLDRNLPNMLCNALAKSMTEDEIAAVYRLMIETGVAIPQAAVLPEDFLASCKDGFLQWKNERNTMLAEAKKQEINKQQEDKAKTISTATQEKAVANKQNKTTNTRKKKAKPIRWSSYPIKDKKRESPVHSLKCNINPMELNINGGKYIENKIPPIPAGTFVYPLYYLRAALEGTYSDAYVLCEDVAGHRFAVHPNNIKPDVASCGLKALNPDYHYYLDEDDWWNFKGKHISEVIEKWGDYTYNLSFTDSTQYYMFNHITLVEPAERNEHAVLITDNDGYVLERGVGGEYSKNLFCILPFYSYIARMNLTEALEGDKFFDDLNKYDKHEKGGFFIMLVWLIIYTLAYALVIGAICFGLMHARAVSNKAIKIFASVSCFICGYIVAVSMMECYHEIWVLVFLVMGVGILANHFIHKVIKIEDRCPSCKSINSIKTKKSIDERENYVLHERLAFPTFSDLPKRENVYISQDCRVSYYKECNNCLHSWFEFANETFVIDNCPECGKPLRETAKGYDGKIGEVEYKDLRYDRGANKKSLSFKYRCRVRCSSCGWNIDINRGEWIDGYVEKNTGSQRNQSHHQQDDVSTTKKPCWNTCRWARHDLSSAPNRICHFSHNNHECFGSIKCNCSTRGVECSDYTPR